MLNIKHMKLVFATVVTVALGGCQSHSFIDYDAISKVSNTQLPPTGKSLGSGFIQGMSAEQTCLHFKQTFKARKNTLCKSIGSKDFNNLTLVNGFIKGSIGPKDDINAIAFYFDNDEKLTLVQSIDTTEHPHLDYKLKWGHANLGLSDGASKPRSPAK
jgi:hypothetical protein